MNPAADGSRPSPASEPSTGDLVKQLSEQVSTLVRDELKLAQLELRSKGKQAGIGLGMFGGSGLIALYAVGCLLASAVIALSVVVAAWLAALIAGVALLAVAGLAALLGRRRLRQAAPPVPAEAAQGVKTDVAVVRERVRR